MTSFTTDASSYNPGGSIVCTISASTEAPSQAFLDGVEVTIQGGATSSSATITAPAKSAFVFGGAHARTPFATNVALLLVFPTETSSNANVQIEPTAAGDFVYTAAAGPYDANSIHESGVASGDIIYAEEITGTIDSITTGGDATVSVVPASVDVRWFDSSTNYWSAIDTVSFPAPALIRDNVTTTPLTTTGGDNTSHTIGGQDNRILLVGCSAENSGVISSVRYNLVDMTPVPGSAISHSGGDNQVFWYYMLESQLPAAGAYNVQVNGVNSCFRYIVSYYNAAQEAPQSADTREFASTNPFSSNTMTVAAADSLVLGIANTNTDVAAWDAVTGQVLEWSENHTTNHSVAVYSKPADADTTLTFDTGLETESRAVISTIVLAPAATAPVGGKMRLVGGGLLNGMLVLTD